MVAINLFNLSKKKVANFCPYHRKIIMVVRILTNLLKSTKIFRKFDANISDTQFIFSKWLRIREALFALNFLSQRCLDMYQNLPASFVDCNKVFDKVIHNILKEKKAKKADELGHNIWRSRNIERFVKVVYLHQSSIIVTRRTQ